MNEDQGKGGIRGLLISEWRQMRNNPNAGGIRGRLISGVKWNILMSVIVSASNFASAVIAARLLGLDSFGAFSIIRSTVLMMSSVAALGLGVAATKYIAELRTTDQVRLGGILGLCSVVAGGTSLCFAGGLFLFSHQVAVYLNAPYLDLQLRITAFCLWFITVNGYQIGALTGFEAFSKLAKINLWQAVASLTITYIFTLLWGLTGASTALALAALINWYLHRMAINQELKRYGIVVRYRKFWQEKAVLTNFAFPVASSGIIAGAVIWSCNAFLVRQVDGLAQMAIFTAANNFRSLVMFVPGLVTRVASPILCNLIGERDVSRYSRLFWFNVATSVGASIAAAVVLIFGAPYLLALFGKGFTGGWAVAVVVVILSVVEVIANTFYQQLIAHGKVWWQLRAVLCGSVVLFAVTFTTAGEYGALGMACGYLAANLVYAAIYIVVTLRTQKSVKTKIS